MATDWLTMKDVCDCAKCVCPPTCLKMSLLQSVLEFEQNGDWITLRGLLKHNDTALYYPTAHINPSLSLHGWFPGVPYRSRGFWWLCIPARLIVSGEWQFLFTLVLGSFTFIYSQAKNKGRIVSVTREPLNALCVSLYISLAHITKITAASCSLKSKLQVQ